MDSLVVRIKRGHDNRGCNNWETWTAPMVDTQNVKYIATITGCRPCGVEIYHNEG